MILLLIKKVRRTLLLRKARANLNSYYRILDQLTPAMTRAEIAWVEKLNPRIAGFRRRGKHFVKLARKIKK